MSNITSTPATVVESTAVVASAPEVKVLNPADQSYPASISKHLGAYAPTLYALGNTDLLASEKTIAILTSGTTSARTRESLVRILDELACKEDITLLLGNTADIDFGIVNRKSGEMVFEGLLSLALARGLKVIVMLAKGMDVKALTEKGYDFSQVLFTSALNPRDLEQKGSLDLSQERNACVAALASHVLVGEISASGGTLDIVNTSKLYGKNVWVMECATTRIFANGKSQDVQLANGWVLKYKGAIKFDSLDLLASI